MQTGILKVLRKKGLTRKRLGNGGRFTTGKAYANEIKRYIEDKVLDAGKQIPW